MRNNAARLPGWYGTLALCVAAVLGGVSATGWRGQQAWAQAPPAAPPASPAPAEERLSQAQLEQLLAPIALHPDTLLMQILMASTYPLEVVQAERWLARGSNASLRGEALERALQAQPWDASVKSLVPFPDVLKMMAEQLEWTQQLGDAVLAQQRDVLNAVQVLRGRAQAAGRLQSGPEMTVNVSQNVTTAPPAGAGAVTSGAPAPASQVVAPPPQIITIEPAQPNQVHVPAYDPSVVYGSWPYPSYPPPYYPPPPAWGVGSALLTGMAFAGGVALIGSMWGWSNPGWNTGDINIDSDRVRNIDRSRSGNVSNRWEHNSAHRQGVAYRGDDVRQRYQGDRPDRNAARDEFRGRVQEGDRGSLGDRGGRGEPSDRGGLGDRGGVGDRGSLGDRGGAGDRGGRAGAGDRAAANRPGRDASRPQVADRGAGSRQGGASHAASGRPSVGAGQPRAADRQRSGGGQGFQGMGQGADVRAASQRGAASRESRPSAGRAGGGAPRPSAGAARSGGGGARAHAGGFSGGGGARAGGGGGGRAGGGGGGRRR